MNKEAVKLLRKYGKCDRMRQGKIPAIYSVTCQGCGKKITTDLEDDPGYVITKRGTAMFWHKGCESKINDNRIL